MAGALGGTTSYTGIVVGGGNGQPAAANSSTPASTVSGGVYPTGTPVYGINMSIVTIVALTATATKSTATTFQISGATPGDVVIAVPAIASGLSAGLTVDAWVSAADQVTVTYSNVSTANAAQIATPFRIAFWKVVP